MITHPWPPPAPRGSTMRHPARPWASVAARCDAPGADMHAAPVAVLHGAPVAVLHGGSGTALPAETDRAANVIAGEADRVRFGRGGRVA